MIEWPDIKKYVSIYNKSNSFVTIRLSPLPTHPNQRIRPQRPVYYRFSSCIEGEWIVDYINLKLENNNIRVKASICPDDIKIEPISIWQFMWFIDNIKDNRTIRIRLNPDSESAFDMTIDPNNNNDIIELMTQLKGNAK